MANFIPLSVPNLKGNELKYVTKAVEDEWVSTGGAFIDQFETSMAEYVSTPSAVACQSGTAGLHLSLVANNIGQGDGVIVPTLTFIAAVNPVNYVKAIPFFMDCDDSLCMDMNKVEEFCERECCFDGKQLIHCKSGTVIKAMVFVHIFGNIGNIEKALELSQKYNLVLVEDATEALGSYILEGPLKGKFAGTIGDVGVFSFNGNKIITTGGGGMVVSNNAELLKKIKYLSTQAKDDSLYYVHNNVGYNYRMTNVQAAIGLAQLEQLESFIDVKNANYDRYIEDGIELLGFRNGIRSNKWFYSYVCNGRDELINYLAEKGIQTRPIWNLIHELEPYKTYVSYNIEKAKFYWNNIVNIPCSTNLTCEEVNYVAKTIKEFKK